MTSSTRRPPSGPVCLAKTILKADRNRGGGLHRPHTVRLALLALLLGGHGRAHDKGEGAAPAPSPEAKCTLTTRGEEKHDGAKALRNGQRH